MNNNEDELKPDYSAELIKGGVRGKYSERYNHGTNVVLIDPDLHKLFPDSKSVNQALRDYVNRSEHKAS